MSTEQTRERARSVAAPPIVDERFDGADDVAVPAPSPTSTPSKAKPASDGKPSNGDPESGLSLAAHPRAARRVAECKAWGGLAGFVLGGYLSLASNTLAEAAFRALITGIVCYVAVWGAAVFVGRRLVVAELRERENELSTELARRAGLNGTPSAEESADPVSASP